MSFVSDLPANVASTKAQDLIVAAAISGGAEVDWAPITITDDDGNELVVNVTQDAIKIDGVRVDVTAASLQRIADGLGALMLTPALADHIWEQADVKIGPITRTFTTSKQGMIDQNQDVDAKVGGRSGIIADPGKDWVIVNALLRTPDMSLTPPKLGFPDVAANYGWHFKGSGGEASVLGISRVIQGIGLRHNNVHADYSQIARLAKRAARLNGESIDLAEIYTSPEMSHLVSHEGPLDTVRQPMGDGTADPSPPFEPQPLKKKKKASPLATVAIGAAGAVAGAAAAGPVGAIAGGIAGLLIGSRVRKA